MTIRTSGHPGERCTQGIGLLRPPDRHADAIVQTRLGVVTDQHSFALQCQLEIASRTAVHMTKNEVGLRARYRRKELKGRQQLIQTRPLVLEPLDHCRDLIAVFEAGLLRYDRGMTVAKDELFCRLAIRQGILTKDDAISQAGNTP